MRLALFADGLVGHAITRYLTETYPKDLVLVITTSANDITETAQLAGARTITAQDPDSLLEAVRTAQPDLGLLAWWPEIIRPPLLHEPPQGFVNTHPSLLPHNRGRNPNFWAIIEQAPYGVTLHYIDEGIDTGDIIAQQPLPIDWTDTGATLYQRSCDAMIALVAESYPALRAGTAPRTPQDPAVGLHHFGHELDPASHISLDQQYTARDLLNLLRARTFPGHPACRFTDDGTTYSVTVTITRSEDEP